MQERRYLAAALSGSGEGGGRGAKKRTRRAVKE
jgi:hypothetical protein